MKKLSTIATTCFAASSLAMAQGTPAPTPAAPRTGLYEAVTKGNAAADNTVDDFSRRPTLIGDRQYFTGFGSSDLGNAAFSIKGNGMNWFGAVTGPVNADTGGVPNTLRLGMGAGTAWGAGLLLAVNRQSGEGAGGDEGTAYFESSGFGVFGDFNLGASDVYGEITWKTGFPQVAVTGNPAEWASSGVDLLPGPHISVTVNPAGAPPEITENHHMLSLMAGWKKDATTEGTHAFNVEGAYILAMHTDDSPVAPASDIEDKANILALMPMWGYILRSNSDYAAFVGANSAIIFETDDAGALDGSRYLVSVSPNFAFQKQLGRGFEGFSGFSVTGVLFGANDIPAKDDKLMVLFTGYADMSVGLRWVKDNFALEGSLKETVLANGPYLVGGNANQGLFFNVGLGLGF